MNEDPETLNIRLLLPALFISVILIVGIFISFQYSKSHDLSVANILPTPTPLPSGFYTNVAQQIPIPLDTTWATYEGKQFPYTFDYPSVLSLGVFPGDPYDGVTVFYKDTNHQTNLFFRVEDLNKLGKQEFIATSKLEYAQVWWKDYAWQGVTSVSAFTNAQGLLGYRAKYLDQINQTPYDQVFFEVPGRTDLVIWISGKLFSQQVFDKLVDSVRWTN